MRKCVCRNVLASVVTSSRRSVAFLTEGVSVTAWVVFCCCRRPRKLVCLAFVPLLRASTTSRLRNFRVVGQDTDARTQADSVASALHCRAVLLHAAAAPRSMKASSPGSGLSYLSAWLPTMLCSLGFHLPERIRIQLGHHLSQHWRNCCLSVALSAALSALTACWSALSCSIPRR